MIENGYIIQGLTDFGQRIANRIVFIEIPKMGKEVFQGKVFMSVESGKWVGRIIATVSGIIVDVNKNLELDPYLVNKHPFDQGWIVKIKTNNPSELNNLMRTNTSEFNTFIENEFLKYSNLLDSTIR